MKIDTRNVKHWWLLLQQAAFAALAILLRLCVRKPEKPIVIFYGHQFAGNLKALYLEWQQHYQGDLEVHFLSLDPQQCERLKAMGIHALACNQWRDMSKLARSAIIVTDHGLHTMFPLIRLTDIFFIDVWHGIPFKGFIPEDFKLQHQYDEIWVPSERVKNLYSSRFGFDPNQIHSLGYARTDKLFRNEASEPSFRDAFKISPEKKVVLYAPTWQQKAHEPPPTPFGLDANEFIEVLGALCSLHDALLVTRCHLNTRVEKKENGEVLYVPQKIYPDTEEILLATDILICDWSSVSFDFAILDRPTLFLDVTPPFHNGLSLGKEYRFGIIIDTMDALIRATGDCLQDPDIYQKTCADKQSAIVSELYMQGSVGQAGKQQIERLIKISH